MLWTGELTLCGAWKSSVQFINRQTWRLLLRACSCRAAKPYGRHRPPNTPVSNLKKTDKKSIKRYSNGRPVFSEFTLTPIRTTENTVEKETARIADKLAPVFRHIKQKNNRSH